MVITGSNNICKNVAGKKSSNGNYIRKLCGLGLTMILPSGQGSIKTIKTITSIAIVFRH